MPRNKVIDCLKGVLIIFVVIRHVLECSTSDTGGMIGNVIWAVQMPGFMLISGYLAYKQDYSCAIMKKMLLRNFIRYCVPFFSWFIFVNIVLLKRYDDVFVGFKSLLNSVDSGLWFLWVLFVLSVVATIANLIVKNSKTLLKMIIKVVILWIITVAVLLLVANQTSLNFLGIKLILYYSIFYFTGYCVSVIKKNETIAVSEKLQDVGLASAVVIFLLLIFNNDMFVISDSLQGIVIRIVAGLTGFVWMYYITKYVSIYLSKLKLDVLGMYTLEVYCAHIFICGVMKIDNGYPLFSVIGFHNFAIGMIVTCVLTVVIILSIKCSAIFNYLFFGNSKK